MDLIDLNETQKLIIKDVTDMSHLGKVSQTSSLNKYYLDDEGRAIRVK